MSSSSIQFAFGDFDFFCEKVSLPMCSLVGEKVMPQCYSRNLEIKNHLIFQAATLVMGIVAIIMAFIMIIHIKSKYTAVGRKEVVMFFYTYLLYIVVEMVASSGIIPMYKDYYYWIVAVYIGVVGACCTILLVSGLVSFQWIEDGTAKSLWLVRVSGLIAFGVNFAASVLTFTPSGPLDPKKPLILFVLFFVVNGAEILIYFLMQVFLVITVLDEKWPLGAILFGAAFYIIGIVSEFVFAIQICELCGHYIDGLFFGVTFILLAVMMVYKYWDSITKEDLEFSVGKNQTVWEIKDPNYNQPGQRPF